TRIKSTPDMAAFANSTTARYAELNDSYHGLGSAHGHASDTITPVLACAEYVQASGRDFITAVVLAYEVALRISDAYPNKGEVFHDTTFCSIGTAVAAGKLLGLSSEQLSHCISMAVVPNVILMQVRMDHISTFKAAAPGHASRGAVYAALLAR